LLKDEVEMKENRELLIQVRVSRRERQALDSIAIQEGRTTSEMLRELVRKEALSRGVWPSATGKEKSETKT
jgi:hypothetical protein